MDSMSSNRVFMPITICFDVGDANARSDALKKLQGFMETLFRYYAIASKIGHRPDVVVCVLVEPERQFSSLFKDETEGGRGT